MTPSRIVCLLPEELRYSTTLGTERKEVTTMVVYYSAANMRYFIVSSTIILQLLLTLLACLTWISRHYSKSKGLVWKFWRKNLKLLFSLALLLNLPSVDEKMVKTARHHDLELIMELVVTNKNRFKFIRLAIDVLGKIAPIWFPSLKYFRYDFIWKNVENWKK